MPLPGPLTLAKIAISHLIKVYSTPTIIWRTLRGQGISYNKRNMFRDINEALSVKRNMPAVEALTRFEAVPQNLFTDSYRMRPGARYRYIGLGTYKDNMTGEESTRMISLYSDFDQASFDAQQEIDAADMRDLRYPGQTLIAFETYVPLHNVEMAHKSYWEMQEI